MPENGSAWPVGFSDRNSSGSGPAGAKGQAGAISLRPAIAGDLGAVGRLHVESWRESYSGILCPEGLARLSPERMSSQWSGILDAGETLLFVAQRGAEILGFGSCGAQRHRVLRDLGYSGEISTIYLPGRSQGCGLGRALMREMASALDQWGYRSLALWVLEQNTPARGFYEHLGARIVARRMDRWAGKPVAECAYGWQDSARLAAQDGSSWRKGERP